MALSRWREPPAFLGRLVFQSRLESGPGDTMPPARRVILHYAGSPRQPRGIPLFNSTTKAGGRWLTQAATAKDVVDETMVADMDYGVQRMGDVAMFS
jgi:hypothetical protein